MGESAAFADFIRRIRAGDDEAARELVARYGRRIGGEVRVRLRDPRLYSRFDWTDVCQSVMASFFVRAAAGQYQKGRERPPRPGAARPVVAPAGGHGTAQAGQARAA